MSAFPQTPPFPASRSARPPGSGTAAFGWKIGPAANAQSRTSNSVGLIRTGQSVTQEQRLRSDNVGRDKRLLGAISLFAASATAWLVQAGIVRAYIYAAIMGNWSDFSSFFGVQAPAKYCLDYCAADLPFMAGWVGIGCFLVGFALLFRAWLRPSDGDLTEA
jgi:hypothetical protein